MFSLGMRGTGLPRRAFNTDAGAGKGRVAIAETGAVETARGAGPCSFAIHGCSHSGRVAVQAQPIAPENRGKPMSSITVSAAARTPHAVARSLRSSTGLRLLAWLLAVLAGPAFAADWYVAPGGSDGSSCASAGAPCQTIQAAINKAGANDTVHVG